MDYKGLVESLKEMLPVKIPYGELVGAPWPYTGQGEMVYEDPKPYFIEQAATAITDLLARAEAAEAKVDCLMEELKANSESDLAKAHDLLSADWAKQKMRAEKAERERDAAVKWIREFTESIGQPCVACKHDTGDYVALGVCGGCSKENNKWEWRGQKEE